VTIESVQDGQRLAVKLIGRMDAENAPAFEVSCRGWVERGVCHVVVDMSELMYVSSMGLRAFISVGKLMQERGGTLRLCRPVPLVRQVFEITRLSGLFPMHDSLESASGAGK
jgi:anti-sigma B factor antagonist